MNPFQFDALTRVVTSGVSRRGLLRGVPAAALGLALARFPGEVEGKKKKRSGKSKGDLCTSNGSRCKKKSGACQARFCLQAPFTIAARWNNASTDHDTYLFVPNDAGAALPFPFIHHQCGSDDTNAGGVYPFAFVSQDATGPGDEVTTVKQLLNGRYEYWIELAASAPAGDLVVEVRNKDGRVVRSWISPENTSSDFGWHVFDIQGSTRSVISIDAPGLPIGSMHRAAHDPASYVC